MKVGSSSMRRQHGLDGGARAGLDAAVLPHPLLDQRAGEGPHIDLGVEQAADALADQHAFLQEQKLGLRLHLELLGHLEELRQEPGERDLVERQAQDRLGDGARGLGEGVDRLVRRHVAGAEMHFGDLAIVAVEEAQQHVGEEIARALVDAAHDAEIDRDHRAIGGHEKIAGVHVGVKEAVAEDLAEKAARGAADDFVGVVAGGDQAARVCRRGSR